ncbi:MAG: hypothetical protein K9G41_12425, partial [Flavobacteriales bacterium]|nr:hypothetical protein [Flavobacteriales bacterium]
LSSMALAFLGNLYKKRNRFKKREEKTVLDWGFWWRDNRVNLLTGFFITWFLVRLINWLTPLILAMANVKMDAAIDPSEVLVLVSVFIGYHTDNIIKVLTSKENK